MAQPKEGRRGASVIGPAINEASEGQRRLRQHLLTRQASCRTVRPNQTWKEIVDQEDQANFQAETSTANAKNGCANSSGGHAKQVDGRARSKDPAKVGCTIVEIGCTVVKVGCTGADRSKCIARHCCQQSKSCCSGARCSNLTKNEISECTASSRSRTRIASSRSRTRIRA